MTGYRAKSGANSMWITKISVNGEGSKNGRGELECDCTCIAPLFSLVAAFAQAPLRQARRTTPDLSGVWSVKGSPSHALLVLGL